MPFRSITTRFRKAEVPAHAVPEPPEPPKDVQPAADKAACEAPAEAAAPPPAADLAPAVVAAALEAPSGPESHRASRLVEGERARRRSFPDGAAMMASSRALAARAKPAVKPAAVAAGLVVAVALGYGAGSRSASADGQRIGLALADLHGQRQDISRMSAEIGVLRQGLDASRAERAASRPDGRLTQSIEKVEKAAQDSASRIGRLAEQLDRMEKVQKESGRAQTVSERLERLEKAAQVASVAPAGPAPVAPAIVQPNGLAPTPPPKPLGAVAEVGQTGSLPEGRAIRTEADPRKTALEGYVLREVDDGYALIETRSGRFHEVAVGHMLPGIGRVEAVERRGRQWVVVTPKGFIAERWN